MTNTLPPSIGLSFQRASAGGCFRVWCRWEGIRSAPVWFQTVISDGTGGSMRFSPKQINQLRRESFSFPSPSCRSALKHLTRLRF